MVFTFAVPPFDPVLQILSGHLDFYPEQSKSSWGHLMEVHGMLSSQLLLWVSWGTPVAPIRGGSRRVDF